jgi:tRNA A37 methylthiotransferase MiaB
MSPDRGYFAHLSRYSTHERTDATRRMTDIAPEVEKMRSFRLLEDMQEKIDADFNAHYLGKTVDVLFEEKVKGRRKSAPRPTNWSSLNRKMTLRARCCRQNHLDRSLVHADDSDTPACSNLFGIENHYLE